MWKMKIDSIPKCHNWLRLNGLNCRFRLLGTDPSASVASVMAPCSTFIALAINGQSGLACATARSKGMLALLLYIRARFHCSWHRNMICTTALSVTHSPTEVSLLVPPGTSLPLRKVSLGALGGHLYPLVHLPLFPRRILKALAIGHQVPKLVLLRLS